MARKPNTPNTKSRKFGTEASSPVVAAISGEAKSIGGKLGAVVMAISGNKGATLAELTKTTGWQSHTVRAALSRLRKRGMVITLTMAGSRKAYVAKVAE